MPNSEVTASEPAGPSACCCWIWAIRFLRSSAVSPATCWASEPPRPRSVAPGERILAGSGIGLEPRSGIFRSPDVGHRRLVSGFRRGERDPDVIHFLFGGDHLFQRFMLALELGFHRG